MSFLNNVNGQDLESLRSRAESGNPVAQYDLAISYLNSGQTNYIEVLNLLRKSSKKGNNDATDLLKELSTPGYDAWGDYYLVPQYDDGILSEENKTIVLEYATKGCKSSTCKGHKGYLLILAHSYYHEKNYSKAIYFYKQALSQMKDGNLGKYGDDDFDLWTAWMDAYTMLGYCYEHGYGVAKDLTTALNYYLIGGIYLDDSTYDLSGIKKILQEFNNQELTEACLGENGDYQAGMQYYDGLVPSPHGMRPWNKPGVLCVKMGKFNLAKEFLHESLFGVNNGAIRDLWVGEMFYKGLGRQRDYVKAYEYFNYIVNEMEGPWRTEVYEYYPDIYADACYRLYECYAYGRGVEKNAPKAEKYFKLALKFGSSSAIYDDQKRYAITEQ